MANACTRHPLLADFGAAAGPAAGVALFQRVKDYFVARIESGAWPPESRVPSENEIVRDLGISRMTAHRALRELTAAGYLVRVPGLGSFVAARKPQAPLLEIRSIAEDIEGRGGRHSCDVISLTVEPAAPELAQAMGIAVGGQVFRSIIVHRDNGRPVQLADRFVNPALAPDYLAQDFTRLTPSEYLFRLAPLTEAEQIVEAVRPGPDDRRLLEMKAGEPCLVIHRRTWCGEMVATKARLAHPGSRFQLAGRYRTQGPAGSVKG